MPAAALLALALVALPPCAIAQVRLPGMPDPLVAPLGDELLEEAIADLDSESFESREAATTTLSTNPGLTLSRVEGVLKNRELTLEQRHRLLNVARARFMQTPRAALGVQFMQPQTFGRMVVERTVQGQRGAPFPSSRFLEPGDMIVEADGVPIKGPWGFRTIRAIILSHDEGDVLDLVVRRGAETKRLRVPMGRFDDLENGGGAAITSITQLSRAWSFRTRAFSGASELIVLDGEPAKWGGRDVEGIDFTRLMGEAVNVEGDRVQKDMFPDKRLAGAGMARQTRLVGDGTTQMGGEMAVIWRQGRAIANDPRMGFAPLTAIDVALAPEQTPEEELRYINGQIEFLRSQVTIDSTVGPPGPDGAGENANPSRISFQTAPAAQQLRMYERVRDALLEEAKERDAASRAEVQTTAPHTN